jgi:glutamine synthetase
MCVTVPAGPAIDMGPQDELLVGVVGEVSGLKTSIDALDAALAGLHHVGGELIDEAAYMRDTIIPAMAAVRGHADALESVVDDSVWPMPKYREMLFIY